MKLYDKNAVAKFLDMTPKNVERLTQKGILQTKQGNLYALAETNRAYIKYLRDRNPESQEAVDLNEERAKLTKTKRLNEEVDLAVKKGELHRSENTGVKEIENGNIKRDLFLNSDSQSYYMRILLTGSKMGTHSGTD